ncbi:tetratricopeptide repeat protein [Bradyrhizobium sp.]|uniref:CHAT domain-containing tetratricopeptide repeat protein n=1 Tax=Bradyrhizobium sp. TaxID=376 RepID=UPI0025C5346E|nr:tetratricopeptide repeat protein [Bradyrhizobium sp.]
MFALLTLILVSRSGAGPQDLVTLMQRITALAQEGRYVEATPLARRLESEAERATGRQSLVTAQTLIVLAQVLQAQSQSAEAESTLKRALAIREKGLGANHPDVAAVLTTLGQIELAQDRLAEAERDITRAVAIDEAVLGADNLATALARMPLGNLRHQQLREAEALDQFNRALDAFRKAPGKADVMVPTALNNIAEVSRAQGKLQLAETTYSDALALQEKQHGRDSLYTSATLNNLGELRRAQGRLPEAEALARRALAIREKALGPDHPDVGASLNNLALVFTRQGRAAEAEALLVRALAIQEKAFGPDHPNVATALNNLAEARARLGRKGDAEQLFRRSLAIREKSFGPNAPDVAIALDNLANLLADDDRYAEAEPLARRSLAIRQAALGGQHPLVASSLNNLGVILDSTGRPQEAAPLLQQALDIRLRTLGAAHPDVANSYVNLGSHDLDLKQWREAHDAFAAAAAIFNDRRAAAAAEEQTRADLRSHDDTNPYPGLIVAAYNLAAADGQKAATLRAEAFEAAQWIGDEQTARAIAGMSARVAASGGDLAARVRQRQDLGEQAIATDRLLIAALSRPNAARNPQTEQALRVQAAGIASQISELDRAIAAQFPNYATLVTRASVPVAEAQTALGANEALLLFTTTRQFTFVWTVTRSDVRWHAAPIGAKQLAEIVGTLRCGLDEAAWLAKDDGACATKPNLQRPPGGANQLPFDQEQAYILYQALLGPVEKDIAGKQLILVPSGPLATLPFEVLLTEKPDHGQADLAKAPWLVKRFATTVLPSVSSLRALRQFARGSKAPKPFAGFGNPLLNGDPERAKLARLLQSCGDLPQGRTEQIAQRGARSIIALSGTADVELLRRQMPLPETALELCAVANSFAPVKGDVYLGNDATETKVKALSDAGTLAQYRVLHFATHGALAGQVRGAIEPGLILTPPAAATTVDDGYLSSSEIAGLKLDADWVVLSACDTAAGEEANAEAFSGLARAFFYAGSRALLVSHWPVRSDAAVAITTGAIDAMVAHGEIGRAEALRRSLVALIAKGGANAQPSVWAPFVLVGNGGR